MAEKRTERCTHRLTKKNKRKLRLSAKKIDGLENENDVINWLVESYL